MLGHAPRFESRQNPPEPRLLCGHIPHRYRIVLLGVTSGGGSQILAPFAGVKGAGEATLEREHTGRTTVSDR